MHSFEGQTQLKKINHVPFSKQFLAAGLRTKANVML